MVVLEFSSSEAEQAEATGSGSKASERATSVFVYSKARHFGSIRKLLFTFLTRQTDCLVASPKRSTRHWSSSFSLSSSAEEELEAACAVTTTSPLLYTTTPSSRPYPPPWLPYHSGLRSQSPGSVGREKKSAEVLVVDADGFDRRRPITSLFNDAFFRVSRAMIGLLLGDSNVDLMLIACALEFEAAERVSIRIPGCENDRLVKKEFED